MKDSKIAWTHHTFNPWWGCVKVSEGCKHCYAETFAKRTGNNVWGVDAPRRFFGQKHWNEPLKWNSEAGNNRARVFCGSMCDWAETHKNPDYQQKMDEERGRLAWTINHTPNLDWLLLTKRIESAEHYLGWMFGDNHPANLWIGTTCENQEQCNKRAPFLAAIDAAVKFISVEPQIGPVVLGDNLGALNSGIDWVIVGGESGAKCRPFNIEWARSLRDECKDADIAFFMKQLGGYPNKRHELSDFPADLQIREFPKGA